MSATKVDDRSFQAEVLDSSQPVLVDFWAPWCGPCRAMGEVVEELAMDVDGEAKVVKVNVDDAAEIAARYGVQSIPSFVVFHDGEAKDQTGGVVPKQKLIDLLRPHLN
jgi:thioredoxin 1